MSTESVMKLDQTNPSWSKILWFYNGVRMADWPKERDSEVNNDLETDGGGREKTGGMVWLRNGKSNSRREQPGGEWHSLIRFLERGKMIMTLPQFLPILDYAIESFEHSLFCLYFMRQKTHTYIQKYCMFLLNTEKKLILRSIPILKRSEMVET